MSDSNLGQIFGASPKIQRLCLPVIDENFSFVLVGLKISHKMSRMCLFFLFTSTLILQLPAGVHGASSPSNTTTGSAFVNFSAATAAASFRANNLTFIGCDGFFDDNESNRACVELLGHARGQCSPFLIDGNGTRAICICLMYGGLTPPGNCVDATCTWGADACSVRQWQNYVMLVLNSLTLLFTAYIFGFGLYVIVAGRKHLKMNSITFTLMSMTFCSMFHLLWRGCNFIGYSLLLSTVPGSVKNSIAIPGVVMFGVIGLLAFPLQWLEVAKKTTRIKATRGDRRKGPYIAVAVAAFVLTATVIFFAFTDRVFLISGTFQRAHLLTC